MKLEKHPLVENGIIEELKLVNYTTGVYVPYSFRTVVWVLLHLTRTRLSEIVTSCSTGRDSPNWANQAVAVASKSFNF